MYTRTPAPPSVPNPSNTPLPKIGIPRRRKESSLLLLRRRRLLTPPNCTPLSTSWCTSLLLLLLPRLLLPPGRLLALLTVHDQESQRGGQAEDHDALQDAIIEIEPVAAGHGVVLVHVVVQVIVVLGVVVLEKVIDPVAERPVLFQRCEILSVSGSRVAFRQGGTYMARLESS